VGTCEFVVRLLARVTGERRGARYDWHKMLVGTVPEKKNMEKEQTKKKGSRSRLWNKKKKNFSIRGVMVRGQLFFNKTALAL
jgi:hypothetical protein